jgi:hypothetical protein
MARDRRGPAPVRGPATRLHTDDPERATIASMALAEGYRALRSVCAAYGDGRVG